jgi:ribosomal protein S20
MTQTGRGTKILERLIFKNLLKKNKGKRKKRRLLRRARSSKSIPRFKRI